MDFETSIRIVLLMLGGYTAGVVIFGSNIPIIDSVIAILFLLQLVIYSSLKRDG
jgi:hypothetical protein